MAPCAHHPSRSLCLEGGLVAPARHAAGVPWHGLKPPAQTLLPGGGFGCALNPRASGLPPAAVAGRLAAAAHPTQQCTLLLSCQTPTIAPIPALPQPWWTVWASSRKCWRAHGERVLFQSRAIGS